MAKLIPEVIINPRRPKSELDVLEEIERHVSDDWLVFQCFAFRQYKNKCRKDYTANPQQYGCREEDGEIDFLFFKPGVGFVTLEVKGGEITYSDGTWFQNRRIIYPFDQAKKGAYYIRNYLKAKLGPEYRFQFAYAVCFPDAVHRYDKDVAPNMARFILTRADLDNIGTRIGVILDRYSNQEPAGNNQALSTLTREDILRVLSPVFDFSLPLSDLFNHENTAFLKLTEEQYDLFRAMKQLKKLRIRGCAGSGKTLMAVKKARELAEEGQRVAIFCYNTLLGSEIRKAVSSSKGKIVAGALLNFCAKAVGIPDSEIARRENDSDFWENDLPARWEKLRAQGKTPAPFDAVLVDEAQDLTENAWKMVNSMVGTGPENLFYVFYDPKQNVFQRNLDFIPDFGIGEILLSKNCRNTRAICHAMNDYSSTKIDVPADTPDGQDVVYRDVSSETEAAFQTREIIQKLAKDKSLRLHENLIVLGAHRYQHTPFFKKPRVPCTKFEISNGIKSSRSSIPYMTSMKFKGCERQIVILYDIDQEDPHWAIPENVSTAMARASHLLYVVRRIRS